MAIWTNAGLNQAAASGVTPNMTYVGISTGCGTLATPLSLGSSYTSLTLDAALPANLSAGQSLTITNGTNTQTVTTSSSATAGATTLAITGFVANANYPAHTTGVAPVPQATDIALYNESVRFTVLASGAGSGAGESLISGYADGTQAAGIYVLVGYFNGSNPATGTGTLMVEDIQYWQHTLNADTNMYQADCTI